MEAAPVVLIFLKAPRVGLVKTRLAEKVGAEEACRAYRLMAERTLKEIPKGWKVEVHFAPSDGEGEMRSWLGDSYFYWPQCEGDLGRRMACAVERAFSTGALGVVLVGGDCPWLGEGHFGSAKRALDEGIPAIGSSQDGGYYLLALPAFYSEIFEGVPWSTGEVFSVTMDKFSLLQLSPKMLETLMDVDHKEEWLCAVRDFPEFFKE